MMNKKARLTRAGPAVFVSITLSLLIYSSAVHDSTCCPDLRDPVSKGSKMWIILILMHVRLDSSFARPSDLPSILYFAA